MGSSESESAAGRLWQERTGASTRLLLGGSGGCFLEPCGFQEFHKDLGGHLRVGRVDRHRGQNLYTGLSTKISFRNVLHCFGKRKEVE